MSGDKKVLLLSDRVGVDPMEVLLSECELAVCAYSDWRETLDEVSSESWPAVVISTDKIDLCNYCTAVRKHLPAAKIAVVCNPPAEPDVRKILGNAVDEYFIHPATIHDAEVIISWLGIPQSLATNIAPAKLVVEDFASILTEARTLKLLKEYLAKRIATLVGADVAWSSVRKNGSDLLTLDIDAGLFLQPTIPIEPNDEAKDFLETMRIFLPPVVASLRRSDTLHQLAITDHLTGAFNRRYFYHATNRILRQAETGNARVTLLLFDIDNFKRYNDTFGHATGDAILQEVVSMMNKNTRSHDIVARIGGDEFAVLFWDENPPRQAGSTPPTETRELASRFRSAIDARQFKMLGTGGVGNLTISGGLATYPQQGTSCVELLRQADSALRDAKKSGKNSICLIGENGEFISDRNINTTEKYHKN